MTAPIPVEYVPAEHEIHGCGAGGCRGMNTTWLFVSGPRYVTMHRAPPTPSTCSTNMEKIPTEKLKFEQTVPDTCWALTWRTPLTFKNAESSLDRHNVYVPDDTIVRSSEYLVTKLSSGVPGIVSWKLL